MKNFFLQLWLKLQQEYKELKILNIYSQLFLSAYLFYIFITIYYIFISGNFYELWLMIIIPVCSLPLLLTFLPEARKYKNLDKYYKKLFSEHQEISFFYIAFLAATVWMGFLWGTNLITLDYKYRITLTIQSFTASLAPLAFYIAWKNYDRKSGVNLQIITKTSINQNQTMEQYLQNIALYNLKDKNLSITEISLLIDNKFQLVLDEKIHNIKAYECLEIDYDPVSAYYYLNNHKYVIAGDSLFQKDMHMLIRTFDNSYYISSHPIEINKFQYPVLRKINNIRKYNYEISNIYRLNAERYYIKLLDNYKIIQPMKIDYAIIFCSKYELYSHMILGIEVDINRKIIHLSHYRENFESINNYTLYDTKKMEDTLLNQTIISLDDLYKISEQLQKDIDSNYFQCIPSPFPYHDILNKFNIKSIDELNGCL